MFRRIRPLRPRFALLVAGSLALALALVTLLAPSAAFAQGEDEPAAGHAGPATQAPREHGGPAAEHEEGINWYYGILSEKDGVEPSLLYRPKGMEPPLGAELFDAAILFYFLFRFAKQPLKDALRKRRASIMHGMQEAGRMKDDAAARLAEFENKLKHVDDDIERVKREMKEAGEAERTRVLAEAKEKRARMEREARTLIDQELKAVREMLLLETTRSAVKSAEEILAKQITPADQERLAGEYLASIGKLDLNAPGGKA